MGNQVGPGALAGATGAESNIADGNRRCHIRSAASEQDPRPYKPRSAQPAIVATDWRSVERNTLKGFFTLLLPSGLVLRDCSLHESGVKRWIGLPGRPQIDQHGRHRIDPATGKQLYLLIVEIPDRHQRERFQRAALAAVDRLLDQAGDP
jgi:hypothetical protein